MWKYQQFLDCPEWLVVACIFQLTKMNQSQTGEYQTILLLTPISHFIVGYSLRMHIAGALQKRSQAVRTALNQYNTVAKALQPPCPPLKWEDVVEYAFISDFDLLCDTQQNVQHRPWATPAGCLALDTHFKIIQACEEIERLNIEVRRVATHL